MTECFTCGVTQLVFLECPDCGKDLCNKNACSTKCVNCRRVVACKSCWEKSVSIYITDDYKVGDDPGIYPLNECDVCAEQRDPGGYGPDPRNS
jgi:hypothetical protein